MQDIERLAALIHGVRVLAAILTRTYYHATYLEDAQTILHNGFRIDRARGRGKIMGPAVYVTADRGFSERYANDILNDERRAVGLLHLKLEIHKFWDVRQDLWTPEMWALYEAAGGRKGDRNYPLMGEVARDNDYEASGSAEGNVAVFEPRRVRVVKLETIEPV